jgi:hypothetical protein
MSGATQTAKDAAKDFGNWSNVLGVGAALGDMGIGDATKTTATDVLGKTITVGALGIGIGALTTGIDVLLTAIDKKKIAANPLFISHGFEDGSNDATLRYFRWRKGKKIIGSIVSGVGSIAATYTAVNTTGIVRHGRSVANTIEHMIRFEMEAQKIPNSVFFQDLVKVMLKCKAVKLAGRTGALVGDCIPGCALASAAISGITGIAANVAMSRLNNGNLLVITACALHWRAFQEMQLQRAFGPGTGPAMRLVHQLYHGLLTENHFIGAQPHEFVREPAGWMVIHDKLTLI